jgi:hypothetical protein
MEKGTKLPAVETFLFFNGKGFGQLRLRALKY